MKEYIFEILENECWWGGCVTDSHELPLTVKSDYHQDMRDNKTSNQINTVYFSNLGRYIYCHGQYEFSCKDGKIKIVTADQVDFEAGLENLREAYLTAQKKYYHFDGTYPHPDVFINPQYCTYIPLRNGQNQADVLSYAEGIIASGMPAGVLIIDDGWSEDFGLWEFNYRKFPNPKEMVTRLKEMGFKVVLWVCNYISPDSTVFNELNQRGLILKNRDDNPALREWWNGWSAVLDFSNPETLAWFYEQTDYLINTYGVEGFKMDAGDAYAYAHDDKYHAPSNPNEQCETWARSALRFKFNELRAGYRNAGRPIVQRLYDKFHDWSRYNGVKALIPHALHASMLGYPYICPDMIGGGTFGNFADPTKIDKELIIRFCQCSALMPIMQFSYATWLDLETKEACLAMAKLHQEMSEEIIELAKNAAATGQPIIRHLEYEFPHQGFQFVDDCFMLGSKYLVAPVLEKGARSRKLRLPEGKWQYLYDGKIYAAGEIEVDAPIDVLPYFKKVE